jgi:hypothetical protein
MAQQESAKAVCNLQVEQVSQRGSNHGGRERK